MSTRRQYPRRSRGRRQDSLQAPGSLADEGQPNDLVIVALEGAGHGLELGRIARYISGFDGRPRPKIPCRPGRPLRPKTDLWTDGSFRYSGRKPGIDLIVGGSKEVLLTNFNGHMSIAAIESLRRTNSAQQTKSFRVRSRKRRTERGQISTPDHGSHHVLQRQESPDISGTATGTRSDRGLR